MLCRQSQSGIFIILFQLWIMKDEQGYNFSVLESVRMKKAGFRGQYEKAIYSYLSSNGS
jgi:hypothetical protein